MSDAIRVGISSCLLGNSVRYDGGHKLDRYLRDTLGAFVAWVPSARRSSTACRSRARRSGWSATRPTRAW